MKKWLNRISGFFVALIVILAIALVGVRLFGFKTYTVLSGSMEPALPTGSLIYVKTVPAESLVEGDVISFMLNENTVATHRIIEVRPDEDEPGVIRFVTKGDANAQPDAQTVHKNNVIGRAVFHLPYLGYVSDYIQHPPGKYLAIAACAVILLLAFLPDLFDEEKTPANAASEKKKSRKKTENS